MRRIGAEGHEFVQAAFSWDAHVDQLEQIYRDVRLDRVERDHCSNTVDA